MDNKEKENAFKKARMVKLLHTVSAMRKAQKNYFQMKLKTDLVKSKLLEKEVDKLIQIIENEEKGFI